MTDPRFYKWLYAIENKIRKTIPICYYHVWDNYPVPRFNLGVYKSCNWVGCISKLTHEVVSEVTGGEVECDYVPHGIDTNEFIKLESSLTTNSQNRMLEGGCKFAFLCNNINMKRKQLPTIMEAFDKLTKTLPTQESEQILLMLHTNQVGEGGHDLIKMCNALYPDINILFSTTKVTPDVLNQMYNTFSVTINIASNEGFGLTTLESLAAETPIICNRTGGLSDQIDADNTWGIGLNPDTRKLTGDKHTPYLYEDFVSSDTLASAMVDMYTKTPEELSKMGELGRQHVVENFSMEQMISGITTGIAGAIDNFQPPPKYRFCKA